MVTGKSAPRLGQRIRALPGVQQVKSRWKHETAYAVAGREFAHFHKADEIDVRLTMPLLKNNRRKFKDDARVKLRQRSSDWITVAVRTEENIEFAFGIVQQAWHANGGA